MKALSIIVLAAVAMVSTSCNTMIGIGRDMRIGGEGLEKVASKASGGSSDTHSSGAPVY